tara:strand:- start:6348 stop:8165 length:1818 start_codon:yes stop_codon:yes gene_type:complete
MGSGASVMEDENTSEESLIVTYGLRKLPDAIEESLFAIEKFPIIIDPQENASRFLKYQVGTFVLADIDHAAMQKEQLNRSLVGALQYGRTLTLKFKTLEGLTSDSLFEDGVFPKEVVDRNEFYKPEVWKKILRPDLGDPEPEDFYPSQEFCFIIVTQEEFIPPELKNCMHVFKCDDTKKELESNNNETDDIMEAVATLYGAAENIRNSIPLVEAAFDGELDEMIGWIEKGFHLESTDGRKHTALSEAACQGHMNVVKYLLENGANPNAVSDTGRSALWRAAFNGHSEVVTTLLESGADPDQRDKTSMEGAYDVAQNEETREILGSWDRSRTEKLMEKRKREILAKMEERIKTSVEREAYAKQQLRQELVQKAESGDMEGIKMLLEMVADEAEKTGQRPRVNAEVRNQGGQSLLSIAAQRDDVEMAEFLLTYWKKCDEDRWDLAEGEISMEAKTFKVNPNSRDLKGWTCVCIAVFHDSRKVLALLLEHGGDPNIRSTYNKNAWDLAKDELDAAEKVVTSRAEIRQVLIDHDTSNTKNALFGTEKGVAIQDEEAEKKALYKDLGKDGTAMVMNVEINNELENSAATTTKSKSKGGGKKSTKGAKKKK